jgi:tRNA(Ile)-lysidine synthase
MESLIQKMVATVRAHQLFKPGNHLLVAVSGGADSVALLLALHELAPSWKLKLTVAHLDHRIRGAEARRDVRLVQQLARRLHLPCVVESADVPALAAQAGISIEMAARTQRYRFFEAVARRAGAKLVATAHTADDQAETLLLRLARGTSPQGLAGIPPRQVRNKLAIIRPLLAATRDDILSFLKARKEQWHEDASNADPAYLRNRVRHEILPLLEKRLNPAIRRHLAQWAGQWREENEWLEAQATAIRQRYSTSVRSSACPALKTRLLAAQPVPLCRRILRQWLQQPAGPLAPQDVDETLLRQVAEWAGTTPRQGTLPLAGGWQLQAGKSRIECRPVAAADKPAGYSFTLTVPGMNHLAAAGWRITFRKAPGLVKERTRPGKLPARVSLRLPTADEQNAFVLRTWQPGDRIAPMGMTGTCKLHDLFVNAKVPQDRRGRIPLLACKGEIVWIPGWTIARPWAVADPEKNALQIRLSAITRR